MFVNILTTDDRNNLRQPTQMQLSQKEETFSELISAFLKARLDFDHFQ